MSRVSNPSVAPPANLIAEARSMLGHGRMDEARALLEPFCGGDVRPPAGTNPLLFWRDAAETLREAGMSGTSVQFWERARDAGLDPRVAQMESCIARMIAGDFDAAALAELALAQPRNAVVRNLYAVALFERGEHRAALNEWETCRPFSAHKRCPLSTQPTHLALGAMAIERFLFTHPAAEKATSGDGAADDAAAGNSAGQAAPERAPGWTLDGRLSRMERALAKGEFSKALRWIEAEQPQPGTRKDQIAFLRAYALGEKGRWRQARREAALLLEKENASPLVQSYMSYCLARSGAPEVALAVLEHVEPAGPDDYFRHYFQGCAWLALEDRLHALQGFKTAFEDSFFDSYHLALVPAWERAAAMVRESSVGVSPANLHPG